MSRRNQTLLYKYFTNIFAIMLLFMLIINLIISAFMIHFTVTKEESQRTLIKNQLDTIISSISLECSHIFAIMSNDASKYQINNANLSEMEDDKIFELTNGLRVRLSDNIINSSYLNSAYLYSPDKEWIISNNNFFQYVSSENNLWLYDEILQDFSKHSLWTRLLTEKKTGKKTIALYRKLNDEYVGVITLDVTELKHTIERIIPPKNSSIMLTNNTTKEILLSAGDISIPPMSDKYPQETSVIFSKYSYDVSICTEHNWSYICAYGNNLVAGNIFQIIGIILVCSVFFLVLAAFFARTRAERIYKPLKDVVSVMEAPHNRLFAENLASEYQYSEIKFILENLFKIVKENSEIKDKLEKNLALLADANKYAAEVQIQSHFIFNTLEIIYLEAYKLFGDDNLISEMVCNLSDLIRLSFKNDNKLISIKEEIEYTKKYIYIQSIRFENCFDVEYDIGENLYDLYCPKLILQPIIENAINHGIIPAQRYCKIKIKIRKLDRRVIFTIEDNGVGMLPQKIRDIESLLKQTNVIPNKNIGISNVNLRIKLMFGENYGCRILSSRLQEGTKIEIVIPVIEPEV